MGRAARGSMVFRSPRGRRRVAVAAGIGCEGTVLFTELRDLRALVIAEVRVLLRDLLTALLAAAPEPLAESHPSSVAPIGTPSSRPFWS